MGKSVCRLTANRLILEKIGRLEIALFTATPADYRMREFLQLVNCAKAGYASIRLQIERRVANFCERANRDL